MKFTALPLHGAFLIDMEPRHDERGYFARTFCTQEFAEQGLVTQFIQASTSFNAKKGLVRGMHFQAAPFGETKLVRCVQGGIFDVIIDLREDSPSFKQWYGVELTRENKRTLYVPKGFAHGYQVLEEQSEVFYMMDQIYVPDAAREISPFANDIATPSWPLPILNNEE